MGLSAADESFPSLGVRASLVRMGKGQGLASSPWLAAEKQHVVWTRACNSHGGHQGTGGHSQTPPVPRGPDNSRSAMHMVCSSRFQYSALLVPWMDAELDKMQLIS